MSTLDDVLKPICIAFNVEDAGHLPAAVKSKYDEVKTQLLNVPGMNEDQVAAALGPALVNSVVDFFNNNPRAAAEGMYNCMKGILATAGGPIGAAFVTASDMLVSILGMIGGTAHGVGDNWAPPPGEVWYGGWQIAGGSITHKPPVAAVNPVTGQPDSRWIPWTNAKTKSYQVQDSVNHKPAFDGNIPVYRSDDMPIVENVEAYPGTGVPMITGKFGWLAKIIFGFDKKNAMSGITPIVTWVAGNENRHGSIMPYPENSFDYAFAHALTLVIEQYLNVQGPSLTFASPPEHSAMNLRDMLENMLAGWNMIHLPGNKILLNDPKKIVTNTQTSTWQGKQQTTTTLIAPAFIPQNPKIGDLATAIIMNDPRDWQYSGNNPGDSFSNTVATGYSPDYPIYLHTGELLQSIKSLFSMKPDPSMIPKDPVIILRPGQPNIPIGTGAVPKTTKPGTKPTFKIVNPTTVGATLGFMLGGPIGGLVGGAAGWVSSLIFGEAK